MSKKQSPPAVLYSLRYVGQHGDHISGVPARDLSAQEVAALPPNLVMECLDAGIYTKQDEVNDES